MAKQTRNESENVGIFMSAAQGKQVNAVGIDLGTTNSCIAIWLPEESRVKVIRIAGNKTTPSAVHFPSSDIDYAETIASTLPDGGANTGRDTLRSRGSEGAPVVGKPALKRAIQAPSSTVVGAKRLIGRKFEDKDVTDEMLRCSYDVASTSHRSDTLDFASQLRINVQTHGKIQSLLPEEVAAYILQYLRVGAEMFLGERNGDKSTTDVNAAVITVPARFGYAQRLATRDAGKRAGFKEVVLLAEPTAAAIAYGLGVAGSKKFLVFDMGGGTFDVSVLSVNDGSFKVLSMDGEDRLGGNDMDDVLIRHILYDFCVRHKVGIRKYDAILRGQNNGNHPDKNMPHASRSFKTVRQDIMILCECLGIDGSDSSGFISGLRYLCEQAKIDLCQLYSTKEGEHDVRVDVSIIFPQSSGCSILKNGPLKENISISMRTFFEISEPLISSALKSTHNALTAAKLDTADIDEILLVGGSTRMPPVRIALQKMFDGRELCQDINPDEVVAEGAAIHAAFLSGNVSKTQLQDILLMDVLPNAIGLESSDGSFVPLLTRNSSVPAKRSKLFRTAVDNQRGITLNLYEGNSDTAKDNEWMARFDFPIPKSRRGPAGKVAVNVTFSISAGGMIHVETDLDSESEKEQYWEDLRRFTFLVVIAIVLFATLVALKISPLTDHVKEVEASAGLSVEEFSDDPGGEL